MLAGSAAARTSPRVRHALLALALFVVAFSMIGMHQLSLEHDFAAPPTGAHQHAGAHHQTAVENAAGSSPDHPGHDRDTVPVRVRSVPASTSLVAARSAGQPLTTSVSAPTGPSDGGKDGCSGCGGHDLALGACLLALTLLVLSWWLAPPRVRYLPPRLLWRRAFLPVQRGRWVPALSLAELCALRT